MSAISVSNFSKYYQIYKKQPGLAGSLKALFRRKYEDLKAVNNISFAIGEGELVGFIGPNGAGKTTTLKCLSGLLYPTSGSINVLGFTPFNRKREFLKKIALVMGQKNQLWWDLPPLETFLLNKEIYEVPKDIFNKTLEKLTTLLEVKDILNIQVRKLSLGQRMKCELIAALIHTPKVLFLDEPTIGLDVVMQKKIREFIREYNQQYKATIILTSHYMDDVKELCERIIMIDKGKIIYDGKLDELVQKYARSKTLTIIFDKKVELDKLNQLGQVISYEPPKAQLKVKREHTNSVAAKLLNKFPVADLNIEEAQIEDIIREVFSGRELV